MKKARMFVDVYIQGNLINEKVGMNNVLLMIDRKDR